MIIGAFSYRMSHSFKLVTSLVPRLYQHGNEDILLTYIMTGVRGSKVGQLDLNWDSVCNLLRTVEPCANCLVDWASEHCMSCPSWATDWKTVLAVGCLG